MLLGNLALISNKNCVIGFNGQKLIIIELNLLGHPAKETNILVSDIKSVKISNWFFGMGRTIRIVFQDNKKVNYTVSKHIRLKNQKGNLAELEKLFSSIVFTAYTGAA